VSFRQHLLKTFHPIVSRLRSMEKPVIGQINGAAAGAGFGIALACDLRYLAASARFRYAFSAIGLAPDSGVSFFLPRLIGQARAFELAATNMPVAAKAALELGLAEGVFPDADLAAEVGAIAAKLAQGATRALGLLKRALNKSAGLSLDEALDYEAFLQEIAGQTADHREGVAAFLEKRAPVFRAE
jgi:2-(1,2-epoxy-1,2-dihydrophenyl)acetyl-CoA isomerase